MTIRCSYMRNNTTHAQIKVRAQDMERERDGNTTPVPVEGDGCVLNEVVTPRDSRECSLDLVSSPRIDPCLVQQPESGHTTLDSRAVESEPSGYASLKHVLDSIDGIRSYERDSSLATRAWASIETIAGRLSRGKEKGSNAYRGRG